MPPAPDGEGSDAQNAGWRVRVQRQRVDALLLEIPRAVLDQAAGGEAARAQVLLLDPARRLALQRQLLCSKGRPEGDLLHKARFGRGAYWRPWRSERELPFHGLPATGPLIAEIVSAEFARARREAAELKASAIQRLYCAGNVTALSCPTGRSGGVREPSSRCVHSTSG